MGIGGPVLEGFIWAPRVSPWLLLSPTRLLKRPLERAIQAECDRLLAAARREVETLVAATTIATVDSLAERVEAYAKQTEEGLVTAITGTAVAEADAQTAAPGWGATRRRAWAQRLSVDPRLRRQGF
jgi:hypothetical protein